MPSANDPLRMMEFVDYGISALGLVFGDSLSQNSFPTWRSGREARLVMFQLGRPTEVGNDGTGLRLAPAETQPLRETWS